MRKTTAHLRRQLAEAEQADDALASKLTAMLSFLDKAERARIERDDAFRAAIAEDQAAFVSELNVMRAEIGGAVSELRGTPVQIEGDGAPAEKRLRVAGGKGE